jgi:(p)ppGpp synthase/HD superfamily hydrolase
MDINDIVTEIPRGDDLVKAARQFAAEAHASINHKRKYTGDDYIVHPAEVASIVASRPHTSEMLAAAWLHDTVEDVPWVKIETIRDRFGPKVAALVSDLTDVSQLNQGNRLARKAIDRAHTAAASNDAKTVKLADLISNTRSIVQHDPAFAVVYMKEKRLLLEVLVGGDPVLYNIAKKLNDDYFAALGPKR